MTDIRAALIAQLTRHEGLRLKPYRDTVGKLTIGVGRNLDDVGITRDEAELLLEHDITRTELGLDNHLPWWRTQPDIIRQVLVNMAFNMGIRGLLTFKRTLKSFEAGQYAAAADEMIRSKWATQVGHRATELSEMVRTVNGKQG